MRLITFSARWLVVVLAVFSIADHSRAAEGDNLASVSVNEDAASAMRKFAVAPGLKVELFAAEPDIKDIVNFAFDEKGNVLVVETGRRRTSVFDIRGLTKWLDEDFAIRTVEDRIAFLKRHVSPNDPDFLKAIGAGSGRGGFRDFNKDGVIDWRDLEVEAERLRLLRVENGKVIGAATYADGFNSIVSGVAAGVLARDGKVWFTCIPDLWQLQDTNGDGQADVQSKLQSGFGIHVAYGGHDMHGLIMGPDGRIYWSIADRGTSTNLLPQLQKSFPGVTSEQLADSGAVFRANPDGSDFELVAIGLRNPQELAFDDYGNLFTGDNNGDGGDKARWEYVVKGGDYGWRIGWQWLPKMGPWNSEMLWGLGTSNTAAYLLPPVAHIGHGPAGIAYYPGTGLPDRYKGHFFYADFPGGVRTFQLKPQGAGFTADNPRDYLQDNSPEKMDGKLLWSLYPVDIDFGPEGGAYIADWVQGWEKTGKARIWRVHDPEITSQPIVQETKRLLTGGIKSLPTTGLVELLSHVDQRVRREAQFALEALALATKPPTSAIVRQLNAVAQNNTNQLARIHAIWALANLSRRSNPTLLNDLVRLERDNDPEIRAQLARVFGDSGSTEGHFNFLGRRLSDPSARVRFLAALGLGRFPLVSAAKRDATAKVLITLVKGNSDQDAFLRHAAVIGLVGCASTDTLVKMAGDESASVRMAACLAMRRLRMQQIAGLLNDPDPRIVLEAARAINDEAINIALPQLASLSTSPGLLASAQSTPILRRVVNAHFRIGGPDNASALGGYVANGKLPDSIRAEAIGGLADWAKPPARDKIAGLYRPLPARSASIASAALKPLLNDLLTANSEAIQVATILAVTKLELREAGNTLADIVRDTKIKGAVRVEALKALAALNDSRLADVVKIAATDSDANLRKEAASLQTKLNPGNALAQLTQALTAGSVAEQQAAIVALGAQSGADAVLAQQLDLLLSGKLRRELELDLLEASAKRATPELKNRVDRFNASRDQKDKLSAYRETLYGGDAAAGKRTFYERQEVACFRCHKIQGEGGDVGPDLSGIGARKPREYLLESIIYPNAQISSGFENVVVTLNNNTSYAGQLKAESETELTINSGEDGLVRVKKSDIKSRDRGLSSMLDELGNVLSKRELRDVVEFLATSK
ncbi:MAG: HEAT repeat domain-containing protein [Opitutaceae bacterium]|nr:HEAT repeat domain-containing protein [Verrucomicrobiales bacterium]